jgi:hypothetical protein
MHHCIEPLLRQVSMEGTNDTHLGRRENETIYLPLAARVAGKGPLLLRREHYCVLRGCMLIFRSSAPTAASVVGAEIRSRVSRDRRSRIES